MGGGRSEDVLNYTLIDGRKEDFEIKENNGPVAKRVKLNFFIFLEKQKQGN